MQPNLKVDRAARINAIFAAPGLVRNTLPPLRSNELFDDRLSCTRGPNKIEPTPDAVSDIALPRWVGVKVVSEF